MRTKIRSEDFVFELLRNHLPHDDKRNDTCKPFTNWEYVIALVLVTVFLILFISGLGVLIT
jgi:hypothetical protein